jgi:hypothetical protein
MGPDNNTDTRIELYLLPFSFSGQKEKPDLSLIECPSKYEAAYPS